MALDMIAGASLGGFFQLVFQELSPIIKKQLGLCWGVNSELEKLKGRMLTVQAVLDDAERRRYTEPDVNYWLDLLKDLAYDMHDIVDEMNARRLELVNGGGSQDQVRHFVSMALDKATSWARDIHDDINFNRALKDKINKILERLDEAVKDANAFELRRKSIGLGSGLSQTRLRPDTSPSIDESEVYGREEDKKKIIEMLFAEIDQKKKKYSVIPIVGMGGLGKTTLAQLVFNDKHVKEQFNLRSWACVSDVFDVSKVTKELLEYSTKENCHDMPLSVLQNKLENLVRGKRFLVVLDDIWSVREWDRMKTPLNHCEKGSIVLVTTRSHTVAAAMSNRSSHEIGKLDDEHCWILFQDKAFGGVDANTDGKLIELGKGIVEKCKGVPLVIKLLGSMLQSAEQERWEAVLKNELWHLENEEDQIFYALRLSYHYLPSPLKRCFEYFALFPADHWFDKERLVTKWICEGLVEAKEGRLLENIASQYFDELKRRCLIQKDDKVHDLVHNLACIVSGEFYCRLQHDKKSCKSLARARHAFISVKHEEEMDVGLLLEAKSLRTMVVYGYLRQKSFLDRLSEWRLLRVVDLRSTGILEIPRSIGGLKHMRYLDLSCNERIRNLPDELCELYSLQYLILRDCKKLENIPKDVGNLINLQCLDLSYSGISSLPNSICKLSNLHTLTLQFCTMLADLPRDIGNLLNLRSLEFLYTKISTLPPYVGKLTALQTLKSYPVGKETRRGIGELKDINNLEDLVISCLENVDSMEEAEMANLRSKKNIKSLSFEWSTLTCNDTSVLRDGEVEAKVLEALEPNSTALTSLSFTSYGGERLPKWMSTMRLSSLSTLELKTLYRLSRMVDIELPLLEELKICECPRLRDVSMVIPKLRDLYLVACKGLTKLSLLSSLQESGDVSVSNLSTWIHLPHLWKLDISGCPSLRDVSMVVPNLEDLRVSDCEELNISHALFPCIKDLYLRSLPSLTRVPGWMNSMDGPLPPPSLKFCDIIDCQKLESLFEDGVPATLESLTIRGCPELKPIHHGLFHLTSQESLCIDYASLKPIPHDSSSFLTMMPWLPNLTFLRELGIWEFPQAQLPEDGFPATLKELHIHRCPNLTSLPKALHNLTSLSSLWVCDCPQLVSFSEEEEVLPPTLTDLRIDGCPKLEYLPKGLYNLTSLSSLRVYDCPQLVSFSEEEEEGLPPTLTVLRILGCPKLEYLPKALYILTSLSSLWVFDCPQLVSFSKEEGLPPTLTDLRIHGCPKLEYLPKGLYNLTSLRKLWLKDCPELELQPDDRLPPNLEHLRIVGDCSKLEQQRGSQMPDSASSNC